MDSDIKIINVSNPNAQNNIISVRQRVQNETEPMKKKKCHGNRKLQRLRKKYRKLTSSDEIQKLLMDLHELGSVIHEAEQNMKHKQHMNSDTTYVINKKPWSTFNKNKVPGIYEI